MDSLEEIYETQMFPVKRDELKERYENTHKSMNSLTMSFITLKLFLQQMINKSGNNGDFYRSSLTKIEEIENQFADLKEDYETAFIQHDFLNHPNLETRRDLV